MLLLRNRQDPICGADVGGADAAGDDTGVAELPNDPFLVLLDRIEKRYLFGVGDVNERTVDARIDDGDEQNLVVVGKSSKSSLMRVRGLRRRL